jgi:hypothetical protein
MRLTTVSAKFIPARGGFMIWTLSKPWHAISPLLQVPEMIDLVFGGENIMMRMRLGE